MLPWKTIIPLDNAAETPVYLQIANALMREMKKGRLGPGTKMPGTRQLSGLLAVHRQTVVRAYAELEAQGWLEARPSQGTFTSRTLPQINPRRFAGEPTRPSAYPLQTGYALKTNEAIRKPVNPQRHVTGFHDGPDVRLVPVEELGRAYKSVLARSINRTAMSYVETAGMPRFRTALSAYLNGSRGLATTVDNVMITRGSQMGLYLLARVLLSKGDAVVVGETNYYYADRLFEHAGACPVRVPVDAQGLDVDAVERLCRRRPVRALYVTSHHHYPTTVTLSAARRIALLSLAERYGFVIIEDDYDYDFHYQSSPILPLVSADTKGMVVYIGTLSKTIAPAIRTGYVVAPANLIHELCRLRQLIDTQGDPVMELALTELLDDGTIKRHMRKAVSLYHHRRDAVCARLRDALADVIDFKVPDGGLAIWAVFDKAVPLPPLAEKLRAQGVVLSNGLIHNNTPVSLNATRMGFAWMNDAEAEHAVSVLAKTIRQGR